METRMQRNKRRKKVRRKKRLKVIIFMFTLVLMFVGINVVNDEIKRKDFLDNSNLLNVDISKRSFDFLGQKYYIDTNAINKYLPW